MDRRGFLAALGGAVFMNSTETSAISKPAKWEIGCFNRPWSRWSFDDALDGMKAAGYTKFGFLGDHAGEAFISSGATPEYLDELNRRISRRGLKAISGWMKTRHDIPLADAIANARTQIDRAARLKLRYVMAIGPDPPELYDHFYHVMREAAGYAKSVKIQVMFKPHGGVAASADEILRCLDRVSHPNFRLWYDAGNIIHYTGKDPVAELDRVAKYVTGFCAKDCARQGGEVMIQFGDGKVDFAGVFSRLAKTGFRGPVMMECCAGSTPSEVTENASRNREFLERTVSAIE